MRLRRPGLSAAALAFAWAAQPAAGEEAAPIDLAEARAQCAPAIAVDEGQSCSVIAFGDVGEVDGRRFAFARYSIQPKDIPVVSTRVAVFEMVGDDRARVVVAPEGDLAAPPIRRGC